MSIRLSETAKQMLEQFPPGTYEKFEVIERDVKAHLLTLKTFGLLRKYTLSEIQSEEMHYAIVNMFIDLRDNHFRWGSHLFNFKSSEMLQAMYKNVGSIDRLYKYFLKEKKESEREWKKQSEFEKERNAKTEAYLKAGGKDIDKPKSAREAAKDMMQILDRLSPPTEQQTEERRRQREEMQKQFDVMTEEEKESLREFYKTLNGE